MLQDKTKVLEEDEGEDEEYLPVENEYTELDFNLAMGHEEENTFEKDFEDELPDEIDEEEAEAMSDTEQAYLEWIHGQDE